MIDEGSARPPSREESSRGLVDRPEYGLFLFEVGVGESAAGEEHVELVVVWVAESSCDSSLEFDQSVDRFGAAVAGAAGVEVGQERVSPSFQDRAKPFDFRDRAGRE